MMIIAGQTTNFIVSYDDSLNGQGGQSNGSALAQAVLNNCENDFVRLSKLFGGIMPPAAGLPFRINLVPGAGGALHPLGPLGTQITCYASTIDTLGIPALVVAEEAEVFMAIQANGWVENYSNGEALSKVLATVLYPNLRSRFAAGNEWLNSTNPQRFDWVDNRETTDQDYVSIGCGTLFLNYLAYQLNYRWPDIIAAGAPLTNTLAETAANLGLWQNAFFDFAALLAQYFPPTEKAHLPDDDPFPLGRPVWIPPRTVAGPVEILFGVTGDGGGTVRLPNGVFVPIPPRDPMFRAVSESMREILAGLAVREIAVSTGSAAASREIQHAGLLQARAAANNLLKALATEDE